MLENRKLAAIMFADVVGYTKIMAEDEQLAVETIRRNRNLIKPIVEKWKGNWVKELGDGVLCSYDSAVDAVNSAIEIQQTLSSESYTLRIGIHLGDVIVENNDIFGDSVNVAARLESLCMPGRLTVSGQVFDAVRGRKDINAVDLGDKDLKNVGRPIRAYALNADGLPAISSPGEVEAQARDSMNPWIEKSHNVWNKKIITASFALFIFAAIISLMFIFPVDTRSGEFDKVKIAVVPFENRGGEDNEYFVSGVTEDILTYLSKVNDLMVTSRYTMREYETEGKSIAQIGADLNVDYLLMGSIRRDGNNVRISTQLVQVNQVEERWAENFDRQLDDIFAIQHEVATEVVRNLKATLSPSEMEQLQKKPTNSIEAYSLYLQANNLYHTENMESNKRAEELYKKALEIDPSFSGALSGLVNAYNRSVINYGYRSVSFIDSTLTLQKMAVEMDPSSAAALGGLGYQYLMRMEYDKAEELIQRAIEMDPNDAGALNTLGSLKRNSGRIAEAITLFDRCRQLEPIRLHVFEHNIGLSYKILELFPESQRHFSRVIDLLPNDILGLEQLGLIAAIQNQPERVENIIERMISSDQSSLALGLAANLSFEASLDDSITKS